MTTYAANASYGELIWRRFKRHKLGVLGAIVTAAIYFVALFSEFLAPHAQATYKARDVSARGRRWKPVLSTACTGLHIENRLQFRQAHVRSRSAKSYSAWVLGEGRPIQALGAF